MGRSSDTAVRAMVVSSNCRNSFKDCHWTRLTRLLCSSWRCLGISDQPLICQCWNPSGWNKHVSPRDNVASPPCSLQRLVQPQCIHDIAAVSGDALEAYSITYWVDLFQSISLNHLSKILLYAGFFQRPFFEAMTSSSLPKKIIDSTLSGGRASLAPKTCGDCIWRRSKEHIKQYDSFCSGL